MAAWPTATPSSKLPEPGWAASSSGTVFFIGLGHQVPDDQPEYPTQNETDRKRQDGLQRKLKRHRSAKKPLHGNHDRQEDAKGDRGAQDHDFPQTRLRPGWF